MSDFAHQVLGAALFLAAVIPGGIALHALDKERMRGRDERRRVRGLRELDPLERYVKRP